MHVRLLFPNKYLAAPDLRGRDVTLTISRLQQETLRTNEGDETKWILHFEEMQRRPEDKRKRLVLNKTNAQTIAKVHGAETDEWVGQRITLFGTTCQAFGQTVDCIRVRERDPGPKRTDDPEPEPDIEDDEDGVDPLAEDAP
jgi:hypothetical protein